MGYKYEPRPRKGAGQPKHKWTKPHAGVVTQRSGAEVGMCPAGIPQADLEHLLNSGIGWFGKDGTGEHPIQIFNVYKGVPYRAVRTLVGISYHGFPCISRRRDVPPTIYPLLMARAKKLEMEKEVAEWFAGHP